MQERGMIQMQERGEMIVEVDDLSDYSNKLLLRAPCAGEFDPSKNDDANDNKKVEGEHVDRAEKKKKREASPPPSPRFSGSVSRNEWTWRLLVWGDTRQSQSTHQLSSLVTGPTSSVAT